MRFTYIASANNTTNGQALGADKEDIFVKKILIGAPVAASTITIYNKRIAFSGDTNNVAYKLTEPTAAAGNNLVYEMDFTNGGKAGLQVDGGNVMCAGSSTDITVIWEPVSEGDEG